MAATPAPGAKTSRPFPNIRLGKTVPIFRPDLCNSATSRDSRRALIRTGTVTDGPEAVAARRFHTFTYPNCAPRRRIIGPGDHGIRRLNLRLLLR